MENLSSDTYSLSISNSILPRLSKIGGGGAAEGVSLDEPLRIVRGLILGRHLFQTLSIRRANKVRLHVVNAALGVHQILILFTLDLYHAHHHAVDHVDRLTFILFTILIVLTNLILFTVLIVIFFSRCTGSLFRCMGIIIYEKFNILLY